ncbi:MAG: methionine ABC transporter permease [Tenericutes bacterium HGW-Tenericutes-1]|jgi:D-methionine transport system permease protein|nr:MAG: methionine ABC transporter permease [Tenericutes bacterium HGW-Tenericutes-1]
MNPYINLLLEGTLETILMVTLSLVISAVLGVPVGVILTLTKSGGIAENKRIYKGLGWVVNMMRSIPFIILMMLLIPFTRWIVGTSIGTIGTIVPLSISAAPFVARIVETALLEINPQLIESIVAMGATPFQIIKKVYFVEAIPSLLRNIPIIAIALLGYSAMAGAAGGGGLGDIAIRYGYYNYNTQIMIITIIILIALVEIIQTTFNILAKKLDKRL